MDKQRQVYVQKIGEYFLGDRKKSGKPDEKKKSKKKMGKFKYKFFFLELCSCIIIDELRAAHS